MQDSRGLCSHPQSLLVCVFITMIFWQVALKCLEKECFFLTCTGILVGLVVGRLVICFCSILLTSSLVISHPRHPTSPVAPHSPGPSHILTLTQQAMSQRINLDLCWRSCCYLAVKAMKSISSVMIRMETGLCSWFFLTSRHAWTFKVLIHTSVYMCVCMSVKERGGREREKEREKKEKCE